MIKRLNSYYKDNDADVFAYVYRNDDSDMFEVHFYDEVPKEEPPVGLFVYYEDALDAAKEWVS